MINTGGKWDYKEKNVYFLATSPSHFKRCEVLKYYDYMLCAVNEIKNEDDEQFLKVMLLMMVKKFLLTQEYLI